MPDSVGVGPPASLSLSDPSPVTAGSVTITLPKNGAVFETSAHWVNPTPFSQSYYAWSCAAVKAADPTLVIARFNASQKTAEGIVRGWRKLPHYRANVVLQRPAGHRVKS